MQNARLLGSSVAVYTVLAFLFIFLPFFSTPLSAQELESSLSIEGGLTLDEEFTPEDFGLSRRGLLPTNPLYFFKSVRRTLQNVFTFDETEKILLQLRFASEKLLEADALRERGKSTSNILESLEDFARELKDARERTQDIASRLPEEEARLLARAYTDLVTKYVKTLGKFEEPNSFDDLRTLETVRKESAEAFSTVFLLGNENDLKGEIVEILDRQKGSEFKHFKNIEVLKIIEEHSADDTGRVIADIRDEIMDVFQSELELFDDTKFLLFEEFVLQTGGNETRLLAVLNDLENRLVSDAVRSALLSSKEGLFIRLEEQFESFEDSLAQSAFISHLEDGSLEDVRILEEVAVNLETTAVNDILADARGRAAINLAFRLKRAQTDQNESDKLKREIDRHHDIRLFAGLDTLEEFFTDDDKALLQNLRKEAAEKLSSDFESSENFVERERKVGSLAADHPRYFKALEKLDQETSLSGALLSGLRNAQYHYVESRVKHIDDAERLEKFREAFKQNGDFVKSGTVAKNFDIVVKGRNDVLQSSDENAENKIQTAVDALAQFSDAFDELSYDDELGSDIDALILIEKIQNHRELAERKVERAQSSFENQNASHALVLAEEASQLVEEGLSLVRVYDSGKRRVQVKETTTDFTTDPGQNVCESNFEGYVYNYTKNACVFESTQACRNPYIYGTLSACERVYRGRILASNSGSGNTSSTKKTPSLGSSSGSGGSAPRTNVPSDKSSFVPTTPSPVTAPPVSPTPTPTPTPAPPPTPTPTPDPTPAPPPTPTPTPDPTPAPPPTPTPTPDPTPAPPPTPTPTPEPTPPVQPPPPPPTPVRPSGAIPSVFKTSFEIPWNFPNAKTHLAADWEELRTLIQSAEEGDTIIVSEGDYIARRELLLRKSLRIIGEGSGANFTLHSHDQGRDVGCCAPKGVFVTHLNGTVDLILENIGISHVTGSSKNSAAIRHQGRNLGLFNVRIHDANDGLLATSEHFAGSGIVHIKDSTFTENATGKGTEHQVYIRRIDKVLIEDSKFLDTMGNPNGGHALKILARVAVIRNNEIKGDAFNYDYQLDFSAGGNYLVEGNTLACDKSRKTLYYARTRSGAVSSIDDQQGTVLFRNNNICSFPLRFDNALDSPIQFVGDTFTGRDYAFSLGGASTPFYIDGWATWKGITVNGASIPDGSSESAALIQGTNGDDRIVGDQGNDFIYGGVGNDHILGWKQAVADGPDYIFGGSGDDLIMAGYGNDYVYAAEGNDIIFGDKGNDILLGGSGNDIIVAGRLGALMVGGSGDDILLSEQGRSHNVSGGSGVDVVLVPYDRSNSSEPVTGEVGCDIKPAKGFRVKCTSIELFQYNNGIFDRRSRTWRPGVVDYVYDDYLALGTYEDKNAPAEEEPQAFGQLRLLASAVSAIFFDLFSFLR